VSIFRFLSQIVKGSVPAFRALVDEMDAQQKFAIARLVFRKTGIPRFVALLPQVWLFCCGGSLVFGFFSVGKSSSNSVQANCVRVFLFCFLFRLFSIITLLVFSLFFFAFSLEFFSLLCCFLSAQVEKWDEAHQNLERPPGMNVVYLPYADELRNIKLVDSAPKPKGLLAFLLFAGGLLLADIYRFCFAVYLSQEICNLAFHIVSRSPPVFLILSLPVLSVPKKTLSRLRFGC
jgi:hypothetical protein